MSIITNAFSSHNLGGSSAPYSELPFTDAKHEQTNSNDSDTTKFQQNDQNQSQHQMQDQAQDQIQAQIRIDNFVSELPQIIKLMRGSFVMNAFYENFLKIVTGKISAMDIFKNKNNVKYLVIAICLLFASTLIGMVSYFLFYVMFFFSAIKCMLWLFEQYKPTTSDNLNGSLSESLNNDVKVAQCVDSHKSYITEKSPIDVLEYYVVPIFIVLFMYPIAHIPIPFLSLVVYSISVVIATACMTNKLYRQRFCMSIKKLFTNKESYDENGNYVSGHEGEFHRFLQTMCYTIECINLSTFNITHNPRTIYNMLNDSESFVQGMRIIAGGIKVNGIKVNEVKVNEVKVNENN